MTDSTEQIPNADNWWSSNNQAPYPHGTFQDSELQLVGILKRLCEPEVYDHEVVVIAIPGVSLSFQDMQKIAYQLGNAELGSYYKSCGYWKLRWMSYQAKKFVQNLTVKYPALPLYSQYDDHIIYPDGTFTPKSVWDNGWFDLKTFTDLDDLRSATLKTLQDPANRGRKYMVMHIVQTTLSIEDLEKLANEIGATLERSRHHDPRVSWHMRWNK